MKKRIIGLLLLLLITVLAYSQDPAYETIFSKRANRATSKVRGYGGLVYSYSPIYKDGSLFHVFGQGVEGGITINRKYSYGIALIPIGKTPKKFIDSQSPDPNKSLYIDQFAFSFTYRKKPEEAFHLAYNLLAGVVDVRELTLKGNNIYDTKSAFGFMINPNVRYEANVLSWLSINVSAGYRLAIGKEKFGVDITRDLHGPVFKLGFVFGKLR